MISNKLRAATNVMKASIGRNDDDAKSHLDGCFTFEVLGAERVKE